MSKARGHEKLEARLGYRFADPELLHRALTHSSAVSPSKRIERSYQRLEFLGDRVLGLVVADMLYQQFPKASEGEMNRALVNMVRRENCTAIARELDLGSELNLGDAEARTGGAEKDAILGDVAEAVIGAIYRDGGLGKAYEVVERLLQPTLEQSVNIRLDPKTSLQEWAQARGLEPPSYTELERVGPDHAPSFKIAVRLAGFAVADGTGASKRIAEQKAAEKFLVREKVWRDSTL